MPTSDPQMADCIFCAIVRGKAPATFLHQDDLVVPRRHAKLIPQVDDTTLARMWSVATDLNRALRASALPCEAVSVYVADGDAAGQEVAHVHIHLIPRHAQDEFGFRFPPGYGAQPGREELEAIADEIRPGIPPGLSGN